jgi:iron complex outermembrane receptor protein
MKKPICFLLFTFCLSTSFAQQEETDSLKTLGEVTIRAFEQNRKQSNSTAAVRVIQSNNGDRYNKTSLVNSFNTVAGVRMEERSPGSYRINIRGSSLRSPFGVRNVKVYWNDIPVTDAGGNTYFNQFAWNNFSSIEIFKGPAGSLYGAGTGGLILMNNFDKWQPGASLEYVGGSYGLQNIFASARFGSGENRNQLSYAHNQSDGYRTQTKMRRDNFSWQSQLKLSDKQQLTASLLFSDMYYQTPGALNLAEYTNNPKAARPAGGGFPSAVAINASIWQKTILAGFSNQYHFTEAFKNTTTLYGSFAQIKNSAIRNYERRNEPQFGGRSVFSWKRKNVETEWQLVGGTEFQQGYFNTQVSKNKNGNPDTLQTNDDVNNRMLNFFAQVDVDIDQKWFITGGISLNKTNVSIRRLSAYPTVKQNRSYQNELAPRIAILRKLNKDLSFLVSLSKGFSPPTTAEVLPSTGVISTDLEAEYGWNYEATVRYSLFKRKLQLEATGFYFKLKDALVQRRDISGADYFVNAGDVKQKGIELNADYTYTPFNNKTIDYLLIQAAYSYNHFRYGSFVKGVDDFSGKTVPSVPGNTFSLLTDLQLKNGFYSNATYYAASKIFLNDANTFTANAYHLLGWRLGWKKILQKKYKLNIYAGADNLLDEKYSLGNDINAAANRFYNAAPRRNYYAGVALQWIKK